MPAPPARPCAMTGTRTVAELVRKLRRTIARPGEETDAAGEKLGTPLGQASGGGARHRFHPSRHLNPPRTPNTIRYTVTIAAGGGARRLFHPSRRMHHDMAPTGKTKTGKRLRRRNAKKEKAKAGK